MGCANSMPLMNGGGGMVEAAKTAVNDTMHAGEEVLQGKCLYYGILSFIFIISHRRRQLTATKIEFGEILMEDAFL